MKYCEVCQKPIDGIEDFLYDGLCDECDLNRHFERQEGELL